MASCSFASRLPAPSFLPSPGEKPAVWLGERIIPPPSLGPILGKTQANGPWACCLWKSFPHSAQEEEPPHFREQNQSPSVFCSWKSWSCKETGLILDFPRAFPRFLSFSQQPHTVPGRHNTSPVLPAWGMRYSLVERTQCPGEGEEWGSLSIGSSSWKQ